MRHGRPQPARGPQGRAAAQPAQPGGARVDQGPSTTLRYRLLALDLDGTLVGPDLRLDPRDQEAVGRAQAAGMMVVVCTGRPFPGARPWVEALGVRQPVVCYQGAQVRELDGGVLLDHGLARELAVELIELCRERDLHVQVYRDDLLLVERDRPEARAYARHAQMEIHLVPDLVAAMGPTTPKAVVVAERELVETLLPEVRARWGGRLLAATSMPTYLEVTAIDADKRLALEFLAGRAGIDAGQAVAVGDGRNDRSMIEWAGLGVAVEGAQPEVLAAAQRTIGPPGSGGIARLVEALLAE